MIRFLHENKTSRLETMHKTRSRSHRYMHNFIVIYLFVYFVKLERLEMLQVEFFLPPSSNTNIPLV
jgi:hypothetical protein